ncbi:MAG: hypothetical protein MJA29_12955, partial [Candidatus Omnitrophica bacterium]|nr:hypothetical protein [Candidatus Omnitrophota bacterium]
MMNKRLVFLISLFAVIFIQFLLIRIRPRVVMPFPYFSERRTSTAAAGRMEEESARFNPLRREKAVSSAKEIALPFELLGTLMASGRDPVAFIKDQSSGKRGSYRTGSRLRGFTLMRIALREVTLKRGEDTFMLRMKAGTGVRGGDVSGPIVVLSEGRMLVKKNALRSSLNEIIGSIRSLKIKPYYE